MYPVLGLGFGVWFQGSGFKIQDVGLKFRDRDRVKAGVRTSPPTRIEAKVLTGVRVSKASSFTKQKKSTKVCRVRGVGS